MMPEMRKLLFKRPEFPDDVFVTVRRGVKWAHVPGETETSSGRLVSLRETGGDEVGVAAIQALYRGPVHLVPVEWLALEHDVTCRNHAGLLIELQRVYDAPGMDENTEVTALRLRILARAGEPLRIVRTTEWKAIPSEG